MLNKIRMISLTMVVVVMMMVMMMVMMVIIECAVRLLTLSKHTLGTSLMLD